MSLVLSDKQVKQAQSASIEKLMELLIEREEQHSKDMKVMMESLNRSLEALTAASTKMGEDDDDEYEEIQKDMAEAIKSLTKIQSKKPDYLTKTDMSSIVSQITSSINNKDIVEALDKLNAKIEEHSNNNKEWSFVINRDSLGKMTSINAKQI